MFFILLVLFIGIPLAELALLIEVGQRIGVLATVFLVILTGFAGAYLTKMQGFSILFQIRGQLQRGEFPGDSLIEGGLILAGGLTLLTPGLITDTLGFLCLLPPTRFYFRELIKKEIAKRFSTPNDNSHASDAEFWIEDDQ